MSMEEIPKPLPISADGFFDRWKKGVGAEWLKGREAETIEKVLRPIHDTYQRILHELETEMTPDFVQAETLKRLNAYMELIAMRFGATDPDNIIRSLSESERNAARWSAMRDDSYLHYAILSFYESVRDLISQA